MPAMTTDYCCALQLNASPLSPSGINSSWYIDEAIWCDRAVIANPPGEAICVVVTQQPRQIASA